MHCLIIIFFNLKNGFALVLAAQTHTAVFNVWLNWTITMAQFANVTYQNKRSTEKERIIFFNRTVVLKVKETNANHGCYVCFHFEQEIN